MTGRVSLCWPAEGRIQVVAISDGLSFHVLFHDAPRPGVSALRAAGRCYAWGRRMSGDPPKGWRIVDIDAGGVPQ